jgi:hypothetical protein
MDIKFFKYLIVPLVCVIQFKGLRTGIERIIYIEILKTNEVWGKITELVERDNIAGEFYDYNIVYKCDGASYYTKISINPKLNSKRYIIGDYVKVVYSIKKPAISKIKNYKETFGHYLLILIFLVGNIINVICFYKDFRSSSSSKPLEILKNN